MITVRTHDYPLITPYEEMALPQISPQASWTLSSGSLTRYLKVLWNDSGSLVRELLGYVGGTSGTSFDFFLPHKYGGHYVEANMRVIGLSWIPYGQSSAMSSGGELKNYLAYPEMILTVNYEIASDEELWMLFDEDLQISSEFVTIPGRKLYWDNATPPTKPLGEDEAPGMIYSKGEWTYTIKRIPKIRNEFWSYRGKVNDAVVTSPKYATTFAIGTLLYEGMSITDGINNLGDQEFRVESKFAYNSLTWNKFPRAGYSDMQPIYNSAGAVFKPYKEADLTDLLLE